MTENERIADKIRQIYIDDSCGCSDTQRLRTKGLTPDTIEGMANTRYGSQRVIFENMVEAPMKGVLPIPLKRYAKDAPSRPQGYPFEAI